jgi:uncharacterized protein YcbK (DUF882 family)
MTILPGLRRRLSRRTLLGAVGWAALAGPARAVVRPPAPAPGARRLKLVNAHTNETFDGPYRSADGPIAGAAAELSEFLRDHHSGAVIAMDMSVIDFLWDVLNAVGAGSATILSAYRSIETNATLARTTFGVAEHSQHMCGRAIDFTIGAALPEALAAARAMTRGGVGWYPQSHFIHVDTGPVRNWNLGGRDLQDLLLDPAETHEPPLRSAVLKRPATGRTGSDDAILPSQYAPQPARDNPIGPSQYSSSGVKEELLRPSQYSGGS